MAGARLRGSLITAALLTVGSFTAACADSPANDFCTSYGTAIHEVVSAARSYASDPAAFSSAYKSTMDTISSVRAKAPDDRLRSAFDRSMFTFSVFDSQEDLANFLSRADFATNAVVITCAEYGVEVTV